MYSEPPPLRVRRPPYKIIRDGHGVFDISIYRSQRGFHASHTHVKGKRWQLFRKHCAELERLCRQEIAQLRKGSFQLNRLTPEQFDSVAYAFRTIGDIPLVTVIDQWRIWRTKFEHKSILVDEAVNSYFEKMRANWSQRTFGARRGYLEGFARKYTGKVLADTYTKENLEVFAAGLRGKKTDSADSSRRNSASSWAKRDNRRTHRAFFKWAKYEHYLPKDAEDPTQGLQVGRSLGQLRYMTPEEKDQLILRTPFELLPMLLIRIFTGIRASEGRPPKVPQAAVVHGISYAWENINVEDGTLTALGQETKLKKAKVVQVNGPLLEILKFFKSIPEITGLIDPPDAHQLLVNHAVKPFGQNWIPNGIRHSVATMRIQRKDPIFDIESEMQTSAAMIRKHYFEMSKAKPKDHFRWFALNIPLGHRWIRVKKSSGFRPAWWDLITDDVVDAFSELMQSLTEKYRFDPLANVGSKINKTETTLLDIAL
jgi:hypothetical protein